MEKEHILREIKRTAGENSGKPLGWRRFESETGIGKSDWYGKHCVRWGDALREAGFDPNRFGAAYDDAELLDKLAQLARDLGRLPVHGDFKMKARGDSDFPSYEAFRRRGEKAQIVRRLREHCLNHGKYGDVVRMCEEYVPRKRAVANAASDQDAETGFVYLMKSGQFYKIGHSAAPGRRQYDLAIQLPEKVDLIHKIPTGAPKAAERFWHERFQAKRRGGEWFALTATDVKTFKRCKSM